MPSAGRGGAQVDERHAQWSEAIGARLEQGTADAVARADAQAQRLEERLVQVGTQLGKKIPVKRAAARMPQRCAH
jgi:hypothetical protein